MTKDQNYNIDKVAFQGPTLPYRGYTCSVSYLLPPNKEDALVRLFKDGTIVREFLFPAYKIYNIQAHFRDIVDSEIAGNVNGYTMAASTGLEGLVKS